MKTAMQEFLSRVNGWGYEKDTPTMKAAICEAKSLLYDDEKNIIDAHVAGQALIVGIIEETLGIDLSKTKKEIEKHRNGDRDKRAVNYFIQTYNTYKP